MARLFTTYASRHGILALMKRNSGFLKLILFIVIALIALGFFGYNLRDIVNSPTVRDNFEYVWEYVVKLWNNFLLVPLSWVWENIAIDLIWNNLQTFF